MVRFHDYYQTKLSMISIITPVYNGQRFIESCIVNVIEQRCPEAEHVIVDGGSTDGTIQIIRSYAEEYRHIRWISEVDQGQSDAMNKGISMSKGRIVGVLNVDDYYEPNVLNRVLAIFQSLPEPSLVVGNCNIWAENEVLFGIDKSSKLRFEDLLQPTNSYPVNPSAYFYHKSLHENIGLYKLDEHYMMDIDFLLRAVQVAHVTKIHETWGNFRLIPGTKTFSDKMSEVRFNRILNDYRRKLPLIMRIKILPVVFVNMLLATAKRQLKKMLKKVLPF
jgi:glycosyltransferase involved in cell wall biosynthesis